SVYQLDTTAMHRLTTSPQVLQPGQSLKLPEGQGTITFTGYVPWVSLAITHDPGQLPALICGIASLGGLLLSFMIRRRRVFVRARSGPSAQNGTTVQVGGLARTDAGGGFEAEFAGLAAELRSAHEQAAPAPSAPSAQPAQPAATTASTVDPAARSTTTTRGRVRGMPVNVALGHVSNAFLIAALVIYSLSVVAFAGDFAFGRPHRAAALASVGAASAAGAAADQAPAPATASAAPADDAGTMPELAVPALRAIREAGRWIVAAVAFAMIGAAAHTTAVITRGLAVHRAPWGNMYEFVTALTCVAAIFFLFAMIRYRVWTLGVFVMGAVVITLGLADTLIYTAPGDLVPALQSYWLDIHVTAMTLATGIFFVPAVLGFVYLWVDRYTRRVAAGQAAPGNGIVRRLPTIEQLDRLTYRTIVFGFPVWTFGVIAGAIWADQAWGRYWGWDPVETWAFITWVLYAAFLHARATAGWRGRRAH